MNEFEQALAIHAKLFGLTKSEAKEDAEGIIKGMMENEGYTREFAEATFIEDTMDTDPEALKEMEAKAKATGATKVKAKSVDAYGKKRERVRKPNEEKRDVIAYVTHALGECDHYEETFAQTVEIVNIERQIDFKIGENHYSLTLTCHRKPKK